MQTKTIIVNHDWLSKIDGLTVADAIKYLQTLDQSHTLNYWLDGDTHGVELSSNLCYSVPMSDSEILAMYEKKYTKEIAFYEKALQYHIKNNRPSRITSCEINLRRLRDKWAELKAKYTKENHA